MSESVPESSLPGKLLLQQRGVQLEQLFNRLFGRLKTLPLSVWQWLLTLLLVIWLSSTLAQLVWLLAPTPAIPAASVVLVATSATGANQGGDLDINSITSLEPFGRMQVAPEPTLAEEPAHTGSNIEDDASDTQLNLVLRGVLASNHEQAARAVIASGNLQEVYAIGEKLPVGNNVTLAKVLDLRVIINNNGKFESLWLFKDDPKSGAVASSAPRPVTPVANNPVRPAIVGAQPRPMGPEANSEPSLAEVNNTLSDVVNMRIHRENGAVVGYKINPGRNAELFHSLGLQADDVVTAVNGMPIDNPGKLMEIYKNLNNANSANLQINRGGSVINLDIVLN